MTEADPGHRRIGPVPDEPAEANSGEGPLDDEQVVIEPKPSGVHEVEVERDEHGMHR